MNFLRLNLFTVFLILICQSQIFADNDVIYANYKYIMGDNDTKNDAK